MKCVCEVFAKRTQRQQASLWAPTTAAAVAAARVVPRGLILTVAGYKKRSVAFLLSCVTPVCNGETYRMGEPAEKGTGCHLLLICHEDDKVRGRGQQQ